MQPNDQPPSQPPSVPDLPDAALPTVEPIPENQSTAPPSAHHPPSSMPPAGHQQSANQPPQQHSAAHKNDQGKSHLSSIGKKYFKFIEFDDEEELLAEIRKHAFGLWIIILAGIFIALAVFAGVTAVISAGFLNSLGFGNLNSVAVFGGFLLSVFVLVATAINAYLYRNNVVFVTNEKIAQVLFITLFNKKISQLSIGDVQDVTVQQKGFLANIFGYGTLVVETAGEQQNYTFTFVPRPYETSKVIINAHELNLKQYGN